MNAGEDRSAADEVRPPEEEAGLPIDARELRELLNRCWMTHDGMWFRHCLAECGIKKTNKINKAALYSAAKVEVGRLAKALAVERIETWEDLFDFIQQATAIVKADFMKFECASFEPNTLRWDMRSCFAYDGMVQLGVINHYQCGIFERVKGWFDGLGLEYTMMPEISGCMMHTEGQCFREFRFRF